MFADLLKKIKWGDLLIVFGILLLCGGIFLWQRPQQRIAVIEQNGTVLQTIDLSDAANVGRTITVEGTHTNLLEVTKEGIRVKEADCPDGICKIGVVGKTTRMVACLPNRLSIYLTDVTDGLDVILR